MDALRLAFSGSDTSGASDVWASAAAPDCPGVIGAGWWIEQL